jgi:hypothetical protein
MSDVVLDSVRPQRFTMTVVGLFAVVAPVLALLALAAAWSRRGGRRASIRSWPSGPSRQFCDWRRIL